MDHQVTNSSQIREERLEVLKILWDHGGEIIGVGKVAEERGEGNEPTRRLLKRMDDDGLVNYESSYSGSKISFTDQGREIIKETPYGGGNVGGHVGSTQEGTGKRLHGFICQASLTNTRRIPDDWLGVIQEKDNSSFLENPNGTSDDDRAILKDGYNDFIVAHDKWIVRFHKDGVTLQLRDGCSIYGQSYADAVEKGRGQSKEVLNWVSGLFDFQVEFQPRYLLQRAEMAYEKHPLAQLAQDLPGISLSRFEVVDEDIGKEALVIDASPGFEELEAKAPEVIEGTAQRIEREMDQYVNHGAAMDFRHSFEREAAEVQELDAQKAVHTIREASGMQDQLHSTTTQVEGLEEKVEDMDSTQSMIAQNLQQLQQSRQEEKDTRDALMELVRSNQNVVQQNNQMLQSNQERMEKQEEIIDQQKEIIEGQQEQISSLSEKLEGLEEKVEDLAEDDEEDNTGKSSGDDSWSRPDYLENVSGDVSLSSKSISTGKNVIKGTGKEAINDTSKQEASDIGKGLRFKDLRDGGKLLEVWEVAMREGANGYYDEVKIRVCGTRKVWARMPREELARLLGTGRLKITDIKDPPM